MCLQNAIHLATDFALKVKAKDESGKVDSFEKDLL